MRLFEFLHKYFGFNKRERNGILILLAIIVVLIFARVFIPKSSNAIELNVTKVEKLEKEELPQYTEHKTHSSKENISIISSSAEAPNLFPFDPNTVSVEEAKQLGFPEKLAGTLEKFRSKGGKFKSKDDLKKLFGMKDALFNSLEPYILIPQTKQESVAFQKENFSKKGINIIDLNTADSVQLVSLPMIGPGFTKRILKLRNLLGGFYKTEQLKEVYGMQDSTFNAIKDRIRVSIENVKKINVNTAGVDQLKKHPYINYNIAITIVNYRGKHGNYKEPDDLKETGAISDAVLEKLTPYLGFE